MAYVNPGQAYDHTLTALKGWFKEMALDAAVTIGSNVNIGSIGSPVVPGLVVHPVSTVSALSPYGEGIDGPKTFTVEMGASGVTMPMYVYSSSTDPDVSNPGAIPGVPVYGNTTYPDVYLSVLPLVGGSNLVALVAEGGYELESTEYDTAQVYVTGQALRCVTSNTDANAGKLTNQRGTTAAFNSAGLLQVGDPTIAAWDTIVGIVSGGAYTNANRRTALAFWSKYVPGTR